RPRTSRVHVHLREQNGMPMVQSPGLGDSRHYAMGVFNSCLTAVGAGVRRRPRSEPPARRRTLVPRCAVFAPGNGPRTRRGQSNPSLHGRSECGDRACENERERNEAYQRGEQAKGEGCCRPHTLAPDIWTMRAFPRSTRICAIVFGNVTTSSFFRRYVVSIPANGGKSSSTCTRT